MMVCAVLQPPPPHVPSLLEPHIASLIGSWRLADVCFDVGDGGDHVPAHRLLLCCGESGYLTALLEGGFREGLQASQQSGAAVELPLVPVLRLPLELTRTLLVHM